MKQDFWKTPETKRRFAHPVVVAIIIAVIIALSMAAYFYSTKEIRYQNPEEIVIGESQERTATTSLLQRFELADLSGVWKLEKILKFNRVTENFEETPDVKKSYFFFKKDGLCLAWEAPEIPFTCEPYLEFSFLVGGVFYSPPGKETDWSVAEVAQDSIVLYLSFPETHEEERWTLTRAGQLGGAGEYIPSKTGALAPLPTTITTTPTLPYGEIPLLKADAKPSEPLSVPTASPKTFPISNLKVSPTEQWEQGADSYFPQKGLRVSYRYPPDAGWFFIGPRVVPELRQWPAEMRWTTSFAGLGLFWSIVPFDDKRFADWQTQVKAVGYLYELYTIAGRDTLYRYESGSDANSSQQSFEAAFLAPNKKDIVYQVMWTNPKGKTSELFPVFKQFLENLAIEVVPTYAPSAIDTVVIRNCRADPVRFEVMPWSTLTFKNEDNMSHIIYFAADGTHGPAIFDGHRRVIELPAKGSFTFRADLDPFFFTYSYSCDQEFDFWTDHDQYLIIGMVDVLRPKPVPGNSITIQNCRADPYILRVEEGAEIMVRNEDDVSHRLKTRDVDVPPSSSGDAAPLNKRVIEMLARGNTTTVASIPGWYPGDQESFEEEYLCDDSPRYYGGLQNAFGVHLLIDRKK